MTPAQRRILDEVRHAFPQTVTYTGHQVRPAQALQERYGLVDIIHISAKPRTIVVQAPVWRQGDRVQLDDPRDWYPKLTHYSFGTITSEASSRYPYVQWDDGFFCSVHRDHLARTTVQRPA